MSNPVLAAGKYRTLGLSILPLAGKMPAVAWREFQQRQASPAELRQWARRGLFSNVGIVCGRVSGNLAVLDFDTPETYHAFRARFPDLAKGYTVSTGGGGWHVYLHVDVLPSSQRGSGVELCAEGRQVVAPPSIHPGTGQPYRVMLPLDIQRVPDLAKVVTWIESYSRAGRTLQAGTPYRHVSGAVNPELASAIADALNARGYQEKGGWLNGPCIYPHRHAHADSKTSFGFNTRTGYGNCFVCGSMPGKDIARALGIAPATKAGASA